MLPTSAEPVQPAGAQPALLPEPPPRLFVCTPSRLTTWIECPRRYRMVYLDRPRLRPGPPWAHNSLGASVHAALAAWWRLPLEQRTSAAAAGLVDDAWSAQGFRDDAQAAQWQQRAREMVTRYVSELDPHREPVGVERTVGAKTALLALSGRIDRLDDRDGELVVVDYKVGRSVPTEHDARGSAALALYAHAVSATMRRPCTRVELHHVPSGAVVAFEHTSESLARQLRRAEEVAAEAAQAGDTAQAAQAAQAPQAAGPATAVNEADGQSEVRLAEAFAARPGTQCGWCSMRAHCAEGQAAGPAREPWAGLADVAPAVPRP